jgi:hypothetical protein
MAYFYKYAAAGTSFGSGHVEHKGYQLTVERLDKIMM